MRPLRSLTGRVALAVAVVGAALGLVAPKDARGADAAGELPSPLEPDAVLAFARDHRAELVAAKSRSDAALQTPKVVSALPDPMVMASIDHLPFKLDGVDFSVQVQQDFPLGGVLGARGRGAEAEARAVSADAQRVRLDVEYEALAAYLMWVELQRSGVVIDEQLAVAKQIHAITKIRLSVNDAGAADVLRAQTDVAKLEGERKAIDAEVAAAASVLDATLARPLDAPLPAPALIVPASEPPLVAELVRLAVDKRPELASLKARVDVARAKGDEAHELYKPVAFVRAGYSQSMLEGPGAMVMLGVSVPIWRDKLSAGVAEASSMAVSAEADVAATSRAIEGEVAAARGQVVAARVRFATAHETVVPLAREALQAMITTYTAGQTPLVSVLDSARLVREARMEEVVAELKLATAWARLGRAVGVVKVGLP